MTDVYATTDDLEKRWRPLTDDEKAKADILLSDASDFIRTQAPDIESVSSGTLRRIACDVVKRQMIQDAQAGMTSHTESVGSVSETTAYAQPSTGVGGMWLTDEDKLALGITGTRMFSIGLEPDD